MNNDTSLCTTITAVMVWILTFVFIFFAVKGCAEDESGYQSPDWAHQHTQGEP
ncbi:hypothetical protein LU276_03840 [Moraxella haemolytica]|uniref:hypothetical protein n=1 Tax=Moraxella haemolytica TaxID=2904119 RepID=UPI002542A9EE|nr:hypothetical protein [Moraxella sp. ZY171148]WII95955.1 hypothetical protein LU276_03840 [Moraxella sp. ZY171148]